MLHAESLVEGRVVEIGDVPSGIDVRVAGSQRGVDPDAVLHLQSRHSGQLDVRLNTNPRHNAICYDFPLGVALGVASLQERPVAAHLQVVNPMASQDFHPLLLVEAVQELGQIERKHAAADARLGEGHHHFLTVHLPGPPRFPSR
jgi:hypothetical protein